MRVASPPSSGRRSVAAFPPPAGRSQNPLATRPPPAPLSPPPSRTQTPQPGRCFQLASVWLPHQSCGSRPVDELILGHRRIGGCAMLVARRNLRRALRLVPLSLQCTAPDSGSQSRCSPFSHRGGGFCTERARVPPLIRRVPIPWTIVALLCCGAFIVLPRAQLCHRCPRHRSSPLLGSKALWAGSSPEVVRTSNAADAQLPSAAAASQQQRESSKARSDCSQEGGNCGIGLSIGLVNGSESDSHTRSLSRPFSRWQCVSPLVIRIGS